LTERSRSHAAKLFLNILIPFFTSTLENFQDVM
jgi:hypothetical protein